MLVKVKYNDNNLNVVTNNVRIPAMANAGSASFDANGNIVATEKGYQNNSIAIVVSGTVAIPANRFVESTGRLGRLEMNSIGISLDSGNVGDTINVAIGGVALIELAGDVIRGQDVVSNSIGQAIPNVSSPVTNGISLETKTAGQLCQVIIKI